MTTEPKCVCRHLCEIHEAIDGECGVAGCGCEHYRPVLDWPDAAGCWWSKQTGCPVNYWPCDDEVCHDGEFFSPDEWRDEFSPDEFTRCERNPFEVKR